MGFTSLIKDLSESKYRSIILFGILAVATVLPGITFLYMYNREFVITAPFGITILLALAITLPVFIVCFLIYTFTSLHELATTSPGETEEEVFEEFIFVNLIISGLFCFLLFYVIIIGDAIMLLRKDQLPSILATLLTVAFSLFAFLIKRLICFIKAAKDYK